MRKELQITLFPIAPTRMELVGFLLENQKMQAKNGKKIQTTSEVVENNVGSFKARMVRIRVTRSP